MPRGTERAGFDVTTRVRLLESDIDAIESALTQHIHDTAERLETLVTETRTQTEALRESIASNARIGVSVLASLLVASVMLAINLVIQH